MSTNNLTTVALILLMISSANSKPKGIDFGGEDQRTITLAIGALGFLATVFYDLSTLSPSIKRKHENHNYKLIYHGRYSEPAAYTFGQPNFSRAALVTLTSQQSTSNYITKSEADGETSKTPLYWSLGATVVPVAFGLLIQDFDDGYGPVRNKIAGFSISSAAIFGPSAGHFYRKKIGRGLLTSALRLGLGFLTLLSLDLHDHT